MKEVISKYGPGEVAWVYRHFPIDELHPKARKEAVALECAGELGGNDLSGHIQIGSTRQRQQIIISILRNCQRSLNMLA